MTRPEVDRIRRQLAVTKVREDDPLPLEAILERLRRHASRLFEENAGDREFDIGPMLHAEGRDGAAVVAAGQFGDDEDKAAMVAAWQLALGQVAGRAWGMMLTAWGLEATLDGEGAVVSEEGPVMDPDDPRYLSPREHPERKEWAVVQGSDLRRAEIWRADVVRDDDGVRLTEWERIGEGTAGDAGGELVEPFVQTIMLSAIAEAFRLILVERPDEWWTDDRLRAANRSLGRVDAVVEGRFQIESNLEGRFAQAVDDFRTLGLVVERDGVLAPADELYERAGIA